MIRGNRRWGGRGDDGSAMVAWRGDLPDLPAQFPRHRWRRRGRPAGHRRAPRPRGVAGRRRDLDLAVLQVADARLRLRHFRLLRRRSAVRHAGRFRPPAAPRRMRAGPEGDDRPGAQPLLDRASVVRRKPRRTATTPRPTGTCGPMPSPMARPPNNWLSIFGGVAWTLGAAPAPVLPAQLPELAAAAELPQPAGVRGAAGQRCASGSNAASTASAWIRSTSRSTTRSCATTRPSRWSCGRAAASVPTIPTPSSTTPTTTRGRRTSGSSRTCAVCWMVTRTSPRWAKSPRTIRWRR